MSSNDWYTLLTWVLFFALGFFVGYILAKEDGK